MNKHTENDALAATSAGTSRPAGGSPSDFDFYPVEQAQCYFADEQALLESGQALIGHEEQATNRRSGELGWTLTTKVHLRAAQGIVHNIVISLLGGMVAVESRPNAGACFTFRLPTVAPEPHEGTT